MMAFGLRRVSEVNWTNLSKYLIFVWSLESLQELNSESEVDGYPYIFLLSGYIGY